MAAVMGDLPLMQDAVKLLIESVGEDVKREGLVDTPKVGDMVVNQWNVVVYMRVFNG